MRRKEHGSMAHGMVFVVDRIYATYTQGEAPHFVYLTYIHVLLSLGGEPHGEATHLLLFRSFSVN